MKNQRKDLLMKIHFLAMISINLFCCCEKVLTQMIAWMIGKNLLKHHYLKNEIFTVT